MKISCVTGQTALWLGSPAAALCAMATAGFQACDLSFFHIPWDDALWTSPDAAFDQRFTDLRAVAREANIAVGQTHAPFPSTTGDPQQDALRLHVMKRSIRATALLDCPYIVVHPPMHMDIDVEGGREAAMEDAYTFYSALVPELKAHGIQVAVENMFRTDPDGKVIPTYFSTSAEMLTLLNRLGNEHFCACLDVGHSLLVGEPAGDAIRSLGPWLKVLHLQDNNGRVDQHNMPGLGKVNWDEVVAALGDIGYSGTFNLESNYPLHMPGEESSALYMLAKAARKYARMLENA